MEHSVYLSIGFCLFKPLLVKSTSHLCQLSNCDPRNLRCVIHHHHDNFVTLELFVVIVTCCIQVILIFGTYFLHDLYFVLMCHRCFSVREGKYIPLPQRQREMNRERVERGPGGPPPHSRISGGYRSNLPSSSSPRPSLPSASGPQPGVTPSERGSPLSSRGGAYAPHHPQGSPSPGPGSGPTSPYTPASPGGPASASAAPSPASPPGPHGHTVPHSHSLPHSLSDAGRPVNGGKQNMVSEITNNCGMLLIQHPLERVWETFSYFSDPIQSLLEHLPKPKDLLSQAEQPALQTHTLSQQVQIILSHPASCCSKFLSCINEFRLLHFSLVPCSHSLSKIRFFPGHTLFGHFCPFVCPEDVWPCASLPCRWYCPSSYLVWLLVKTSKSDKSSNHYSATKSIFISIVW